LHIDLDKIGCVDAKCHANDDEQVKIDTEVELQYGGRPFSETGSSSNSAVD